MTARWTWIVLAVLVSLAALVRGQEAEAPRLTMHANGEHFIITYAPGAVWACTMFQQQTRIPPTPNWTDGHYTPRHCWGLEGVPGGYEDDWAYILPADDDWVIWAEVGYPDETGLLVYRRSNTLRVHR